MKLKIWLVSAVAAGLAASTAQAAISYSTPASTYIENFDSLPSTPENASLQSTIPWTDDSTSTATSTSIPGWFLYHPTTQAEGGANGNQRLRIGAGSANTGSFWSFGSSGSGERALGVIGSTTITSSGGDIFYGARFTNATGATLTEFTLSYTAEQWRDGGQTTTGSVAQSVLFGYKVTSGPAALQDSGYTDVDALGFVSPTFGATAGAALNGNDAANQVAVGPVTVTGLAWAPGDDLWIRWRDVDHPSNDHGLAIDNVSFSANVPEPASLSLLGIGLLTQLVRRRRRA